VDDAAVLEQNFGAVVAESDFGRGFGDGADDGFQ